MSKSQPLIFFGTEDFSAVSLEALIQAGFDIALVITKPDHKTGRGQILAAPKVKQIATAHGIEVLQPNDIDEVTDKITSVNPSFGVLVSYGKLIPKRTLDLFKGGIINVHPSLLPHWRGPSPIESAILNGDDKTGVSIMKLSESMDEGPVYAQQEVELNGSETRPQLYDQLATHGAKLLVDKLPQIINGALAPKPQDDTKATYSKMIKKEDGKLDFINKTADKLDREIRAYLGWPKSYASLGKLDVVITSVLTVPSNYKPGLIDVVDDDDVMALFIYCKEGTLDILSLQPSGKKEMKIREFLAGYKEKITN